MPHSEGGFSESVMGIMRNLISYSDSRVNLSKPSWSLHAHSCYCPPMEATGECGAEQTIDDGVSPVNSGSSEALWVSGPPVFRSHGGAAAAVAGLLFLSADS